MNDSQIKVFLTIANTRSISRAAEALYISQSTVSMRLKDLEKELGLELFIRQRGQRTLKLTSAGEAFMSVANRWMNLQNEAIDLKSRSLQNSLSIGVMENLNIVLMRPLYKQLMDPALSLSLSIKQNNSRFIYDLVENNEVDIGFVAFEHRRKNVSVTPIYHEPYSLLVFDSSRAEVPPTDPQDLDPAQELYQPWDNTHYMFWHEYWFPGKKQLLKFNTATLLPSLMTEDGMWAILPRATAVKYSNLPNMHIVKLLDEPPSLTYYKLLNRTPHPYAMRGIALVEKLLPQILPYNDYTE